MASSNLVQTNDTNSLEQMISEVPPRRRRHAVAGLLAPHADATTSDVQTAEDRIRMPVKLVGKNSPVDMAHCMNPVAHQDTAQASKLRRSAVVQNDLARGAIVEKRLAQESEPASKLRRGAIDVAMMNRAKL